MEITGAKNMPEIMVDPSPKIYNLIVLIIQIRLLREQRPHYTAGYNTKLESNL